MLVGDDNAKEKYAYERERERESQSIRTYSLKKKKKIEETNRISSNVRAPDTLVINNT